ncbi:hypothetical protein SAMN04488526_1795 [Jannaschia helgolandensis]|jgi:hypothetical protein|uniref:Uncharacterized protein n=1 Tax=Jannaschia helgolandensis TaxID=188906 RepID=A0A1H7LQG5_9RHOB|nr:hypothetical protein SAMN04488526_1795 [Jannaschia helgolandensis]
MILLQTVRSVGVTIGVTLLSYVSRSVQFAAMLRPSASLGKIWAKDERSLRYDAAIG